MDKVLRFLSNFDEFLLILSVNCSERFLHSFNFFLSYHALSLFGGVSSIVNCEYFGDTETS